MRRTLVLAVCLGGSIPFFTASGAQAKAGTVVLTESTAHATVAPGEVVQVRLHGHPDPQCPTGWGPITSSKADVLSASGPSTSGATASADFRAGAEGMTRVTSAQQALAPRASAGTVVCTGAVRLWVATVTVQAPSAALPFTGAPLAPLAVAAAASIVVGTAMSLRGRRRRIAN